MNTHTRFPVIVLAALIAFSSTVFARFERGDRPGGLERNSDRKTTNSQKTEIFIPPEVKSVGLNLQSINAQLKGRLRFDPILEINPNRGSFATEIVVPLPPNLAGISEIKLQYMASNFENIGLGVGWRWNLPLISPNPKPVSRIPYITSGLLGANELVRIKNENLEPQKSKVIDLLIKTGLALRGSAVELHAYRPSVDEKFVLYVNVLKNNSSVAWVAMTLDGSRWIFSSEGLPLLYSDKADNSVSFEWHQGLLGKISDTTGGWVANIQYTETKQLFEQRTPQGWHRLPHGLSSVQIDRRILRFITDAEGYLLRAGWVDGLIPLFQASYSVPKQTRDSISNQFGYDDKKRGYWMDISSSAKMRELLHDESTESDMLVDLNGDGRTDRIRFDMKRYNKEVSAIAHAHAGEDIPSLQSKIDSVGVQTDVQIAVANRPGESARWVSDASLSHLLNHHVRPISLFVDKKRSGVELGAVPNGVFLVDLNGDGRKDLVHCRNGIPLLQRYDKNGTKDSIYEILSWFRSELGGNRLSDGKWINRYTTAQASQALVAIQKPDDSKYDRIWREKGNSVASFITSASSWDVLSSSGFSCNYGTLFIDANKDGRIDILTDKTLYLAGERPGEYCPRAVDPREFFEAPSEEKYDFKNPSMVLVDTDGNGKLEVRQARGGGAHPYTGRVELIRDGLTEYIDPLPQRRLLTKMDSHFGGRYNITYRFEQGQWVVSEIIKDPGGDQPVSRTAYSYQSAIRDRFRGAFIGFSFTQETTTLDESRIWMNESKASSFTGRIPKRIVTREYTEDAKPAVLLFHTRGRLNGRPKLTIVESDDPSSKGVLSQTFHKTQPLELPYGRVTPVVRQESWSYEMGSDRVRDWKTVSRHPVRDNWYRDEAQNRLVPLAEFIEELGQGYYSRHSDSLLQAVRRTDVTYAFDPTKYLRLVDSIVTKDKDGVTYRAPLKVSYDTAGFPARACRDKRCITWKFDANGRLIESVTPMGRWQGVSYEGEYPLPVLVETPDGIERRQYEKLTGEVLFHQIPTGALFKREYSTDGLLLKMTAQEYPGAPEKTYFKLHHEKIPRCSLEKETCSLGASIEISQRDTSESWLLDGFGRVVSVLFPDKKNGSRNTGKTYYGPGETVLAQTLPSFGETLSSTRYSNSIFDAAGRILRTDFNDGSRVEHSYPGSCIATLQNGYFTSKTCTSALGNLTFVQEGSEALAVQTTSDGDFLGLSSLGIQWSFNRHGEIAITKANIDEVRAELRDGAAGWNQSILEISLDGRIVRNGYTGYTWVKDESGRLIRAGRTEVPALGADLSENIEYENGLIKRHVIAHDKSGGKTVFAREFTYNGFGKIKTANFADVLMDFDYDVWDRLKRVEIKHGENPLGSFDYVFQNGKLKGLNGGGSGKARKFSVFATDDEFERLTEFKFGSALKVTRTYYSSSSRLSGVFVEAPDGKTLWSEVLEESGVKQIVGRASQSILDRHSETFKYDPSNYHLLSDATSKATAKRDHFGRVSELSGNRLYWTDENLVRVGDQIFYYDSSGSLVLSCRIGLNPVKDFKKCFVRLDPDTVLIEGSPVALIRFGSTPVGVLIDGNTYPVVTDHLGSIRAMFSPDGTELLWSRHYGPWGEKIVAFNTASAAKLDIDAKQLERKTVWSYAHLIEVPGADAVADQSLYWSKTRVYSPALREWLSPDPLVKWNPKALVDKPGNWHSVRYASGRPMEYVDPAGSDILIAALILGGTKAATIGLGYLGLKASQKMHNTSPVVAAKQNQDMGNAAKLLGGLSLAQIGAMGLAAPAELLNVGLTVAMTPKPYKVSLSFASGFLKGLAAPHVRMPPKSITPIEYASGAFGHAFGQFLREIEIMHGTESNPAHFGAPKGSNELAYDSKYFGTIK